MNRLAASICALIVAIATAQPAAAGQVSITLTPKGEAAGLVRTGLAIYSLIDRKKQKNRATVDQRGTGNAAAVAQSGSGNWAKVVQRGSGHTATAAQSGSRNALGIFQFGKRTSTEVKQTGNGRVGIVLQGGW